MNERMTRTILSQARSSLEPTQADRDRMHKKVMAAVGAAGVVTAAAATAAKAAGGFSHGVPHLASVIFKLVLGGLIVGGAAGLTMMALTDNDADGKSVPAAVFDSPFPAMTPTGGSGPAVSQQPQEEDAPAQAAPLPSPEGPSPSVDKETRTGAVRTKASKGKSVENATVPNDDALLREIALIKSASSALAGGDAEKTLDILSEYDDTFPSGVMRQERDGLRILALCEVGRRDQAKKEAQKFYRQYPSSPSAVRIRSSCGEF